MTLAAVLAIVFGLTAYVVVLADVTPDPRRDLASPTLDRVHDRLTTGGVTDPDRLDDARAVGPSGYEVNVSLVMDGLRRTAGPTPAQGASHASRSVGVEMRPGVVRRATLSVEVWS
ncbi:DUF7285 family protein [Halorarum salinum]|uniref:Uncharacterized protein n=1 Tax=Halorarum salinum TaxID=2743089 RepID=A0A7D5LCX0_9EURY|nr:hypothetical protein [Halobaculum salinum]QLG62995.1 hypothetical protein HUG12_15145 [Halobaculum salinum]